jgi:hypothetical protein
MLNLWWGLTEQTYLYYWHQKIWSVLVAWAIVVLVLVLMILLGEELWRAGYRAALRSAGPVDAPPTRQQISRAAQVSADADLSQKKRRFLAPPSEAFPSVRTRFSSSRQPELAGKRVKSTLV